MGHVLLGLPVNSFKLALLGPHFAVVEAGHDESAVLITEQIHKCISSCFLTSFPRNFDAILTHGLACCLYNFETLDNLLPVTHHICSCFLFKGDFTTVKQVVKCGLPWLEDFLGVSPTGIPSHVALLAQMQELREIYGWVSDG